MVSILERSVDGRMGLESVEGVNWSKYGKEWQALVERLIQALKDENRYVRWGAAGALGELRDAKAVEPLIQVLRDECCFVRGRAACALGKIGEVAVKPLVKLLEEDENSIVRREAERALRNLGLETPPED